MSANPTEAAEVPLMLSADDRAVVLREIKDAQFALATVAEQLTEEELPINRELTVNCLQMCEFRLDKIGTKLGIATDSAARLEERHARLRTANLRIHELEAQLGQAQPPEATQLSLVRLTELVQRWWQADGFGHTSEIHFARYGTEVEFSCHLFGDFRLTDSPTPISDKERRAQWHANLKAQGYVLTQVDPASRDLAVVDCDASRKTLAALFATHLPSAKIQSVKNRNNRDGDFVMDSVTVMIRNLADIANLPAFARE